MRILKMVVKKLHCQTCDQLFNKLHTCLQIQSLAVYGAGEGAPTLHHLAGWNLKKLTLETKSYFHLPEVLLNRLEHLEVDGEPCQSTIRSSELKLVTRV